MLAALFLVSLLSSGLAAPTAAGRTHHILAKRSLLWPGRLFGGDRWGVVIGPSPTADQAVVAEPADKTASTVAPAINPAASPSGGVPVVPVDTTPLLSSETLIQTSTTLASFTTKAPNGFQALKPTTSRSLQPSSLTSSVLSTPSTRSSSSSSTRSTPKPSSTKTSTTATRPSSTSKPSPRPTSTSTSKPPSTPKPSSTPSPKPTSSPKPTPSPTPTPKPSPKPSSTTKVIITTTRQPQPTTPKPAPTSTTTSTKITQQPAPAPTSGSGGSGGTPAADIAEYLKGHNDERAQHGAAPLSWNETLAGKAQQWANNCQFKHSGGTLGPFGENLAAGTGSFSITDGIRAWNDEAPDYNPSNPQASHWTQVVWKSSTQVGCAVQRCTGIFGSSVANYFVCEYAPQGNFIGRFAENVQK